MGTYVESGRFISESHQMALELGIDLATRLEAVELADHLRAATRAVSGPLPVALLGEQAPKARLLNAFVGREALDHLYGRRRVRRLVAGRRDGIALSQQAGAPLPFGTETWRLVDRLPPEVDVQVDVDNGRLRDLNVALVDFPMSGGLQPGDPQWTALQLCQVAVLIVGAGSMITRQEAELLRQLAVGLGPICAAAVVVGIETVTARERQDVLDGIRRVLERNAGPARLIVPSDGTSGGDELEELLTALILEADHGRALGSQLEARLRVAVTELQALAVRRAEQTALSKSDRELELETLEEQHRTEVDEAACLQVTCRERFAAVIEELRNQVSSSERDLVRSLIASMRAAPELDEWWSDDLPELLEDGRTVLATVIGERLGQAVASEVEHARGLLEAGGAELAPVLTAGGSGRVVPPEFPLPGARLERLQMLSEMTSVTLRILGPILSLIAHARIIGLDTLPQQALAPSIKAARRQTREVAREVLRRHVHDEFARLLADAETRLQTAHAELASVLAAELARRDAERQRELAPATVRSIGPDDGIWDDLKEFADTVSQLRGSL